jgi:hypothetical protein
VSLVSNHSSEEWIEFRPRPSNGRYWTGGLGLALFFLFAITMVVAVPEMHPLIALPFVVVGIGVTVPVLAITWYFPTMRYWLGRKELVLQFGPLMYDRVPLDAIKSIRRRNLKISMLSSFRFPGLALFYVDYIEQGRVRMCATSASREILLIDIGHRRYGITPEDEQGLVDAIRARADAHIRISENFNPERSHNTTISR